MKKFLFRGTSVNKWKLVAKFWNNCNRPPPPPHAVTLPRVGYVNKSFRLP